MGFTGKGYGAKVFFLKKYCGALVGFGGILLKSKVQIPWISSSVKSEYYCGRGALLGSKIYLTGVGTQNCHTLKRFLVIKKKYLCR